MSRLPLISEKQQKKKKKVFFNPTAACRYWRRKKAKRKKLQHFKSWYEIVFTTLVFLCKMFFFWIFLYYFGHIEDVFLFLIYFQGGLFDMIIIDFHWKSLHFSFVVETCLIWQKKKFSQLFHSCLGPLCLCIYKHI